ncbi:alpha/beta hydrolase (plasmid) [Mycolicibacterium psychrotolerans]|uniref:alpha/beta hydrolase n=1 Tax=Mycolicibacterium psychrotolerans TaxID=216929 RepID=UPI003D66D3E7
MSIPQIGRYAPGFDMLSFEKPPSRTEPKMVVLVAEDGATSKGMLYSDGTEKTAVCVIHPRADVSRHYTVAALVDAGYAVLAHQSRWPNNDATGSHEIALLDIAAAVAELRGRNFENVLFLGYSGGGPLYTFYQAQAVAPLDKRLRETAAGDPFDLSKFELPAVDGFVYMGAHHGAGITLMASIDPSVIDETDPLSADPDLDMYNPRNGFKTPPQSSRYAADFLERYRAAQSARVARIDAIARSYIAEQRHYRSVAADEGFTRLSESEQEFVQRRAVLGRIMSVYRTDANPAATDLSLQPSKRTYGSLLSALPHLGNYTEQGFAKYLTPRAWLSQWSGHSSRCTTLNNVASVTVPTMVLCFTGDNEIPPQHAQAIFDASPASDKSIVNVDGDHFGFPLPSAAEKDPRSTAMSHVVDWLGDRFPR